MSAVDVSLFPDLDPIELGDPAPKDSAGVRLTKRAADLIARGWHPLSPLIHGLMLHRDASKDRDGAGPRCGDCAHRTASGHNRSYNKCGFYLSSSEASDLRLWWPACTRFVAAAPLVLPHPTQEER